jgi:hypothetical protein
MVFPYCVFVSVENEALVLLDLNLLDIDLKI